MVGFILTDQGVHFTGFTKDHSHYRRLHLQPAKKKRRKVCQNYLLYLPRRSFYASRWCCCAGGFDFRHAGQKNKTNQMFFVLLSQERNQSWWGERKHSQFDWWQVLPWWKHCCLNSGHCPWKLLSCIVFTSNNSCLHFFRKCRNSIWINIDWFSS